MSGVGKCKYHVVQFLEVPYKDVAEFVCVPKSWVQSRGPGVPIVRVSYPVEEPSLTEERVVKSKKKLNSWKSFLSVMRYSTDNYENAKFYIQQEINNLKKNKGDFYVDAENIQDRTNKSEKTNGDHTLLSAKANGKTSISTQNAMSRATIDNDAFVVGMIDALGWCVSSKSANTITLKRKALSVPDKENCNKRFRVNEPDESDNQVAGPSSKALDRSSKNQLSPSSEDSDEDLCTQETPVEKFNDNSTEMRQTVNLNPSKTTHALEPKIIAQLATSPVFAKWCMLMQELQEIFDNSMFKELINKLLNKDNNGSAPQYNDPIASTSSDMTVEAPKLNKDKISKKPLEEKYTDNDDDKDQPLENDDCSEEGYLNLDEDEELPPGNVELVNKDNDGSAPQNNDPIASTSSDMTVEAPKLNKDKRSKKPLEEKYTDNDDDKDQPLENDDCSEEGYLNLDEDEELPPDNVELVNKDNDGSAPQNNDPVASASSDTTVEAPKFYKEKRNEKPLEVKNNDDDKDQPLDNDDSSDGWNYFDFYEDLELPPEYDANDSRWTLKYRKPFRGLVELMPHTCVYVNNFYLSSRPIQMAKELLLDIFTQNALNVCRLPGRINAIDHDGIKVRPALDEGAIAVLLNFVTKNAKDDYYPFIDNQIILDSLRYEMGVIRRQAQIERKISYNDNSEDGYFDWDVDEELPPEYDANDSRWTLKYREPAPGNIELMPHTGVYLTNYKILPKRAIPLAIMLMRGIFTRNALNICWLPGTRAKAINRHGTKVRPALNEHAISVLLKYVTDHAIENVGSYCIQDIIRGMRDRMRKLRRDALFDIRRRKYRLRI